MGPAPTPRAARCRFGETATALGPTKPGTSAAKIAVEGGPKCPSVRAPHQLRHAHAAEFGATN